ncbi:hypothetical protein J2Z35_000089 [Acetoanaerobium pronyense]|uniref:GAF domain-containing protein n=1 Tax=Acetoanaerobium pronyense TaxID=1482736 RepID=A0ABS4KEW7_9FIRM|nr:hypothetical protein [Acetoanaerobium pronyense]MBP2026300.1 hypothetical protein [Acetoanaerobium pronyense]
MTDVLSKKHANLDYSLSAIEFYSQVLSIEQLFSYGYRHFHKITGLKKSAIFALEEESYVLKECVGYDIKKDFYPCDSKLENIATLCGTTLCENKNQYFKEDFLKKYNAEIIIPLIVKDTLAGFILTETLPDICSEKYHLEYIEGMKNLFNMSLSNAYDREKFDFLKADIDKKVYNLILVNQCTRLIMAERCLDRLYALCIDVIRELTSSSVTTFGIYDTLKEAGVVKGYVDILCSEKKVIKEFKMKKSRLINEKTIYNVKIDKELLSEIIEDTSALESLGAEYIVFIAQEEILGFVTIGKPVNESPYDYLILNQAESIAKSIYIAMKNAIYIKEINQNREKIENQIKGMKKLNLMIKNINSCNSIDEIYDITLETLRLGYKMKRGFILIKTKDNYKIKPIGYNADRKINLMPKFNINEESIYFSHGSENIKNYFDIEDYKGDENCIIICPIKTEELSSEKENIYGYIVITQIEDSVDEKNILIIETISNSISPIIRQMEEKEKKTEGMIKDSRFMFYRAIEEFTFMKKEYDMDFKVYYKIFRPLPFTRISLENYDYENIYCYDNVIMVISLGDEEIIKDDFDGFVTGETGSEIEKNIIKNISI